MKKNILLVALLIALAINSFAQDRRAFINFSNGLAVPVGAFAYTHNGYNQSGYALQGYTFSFNYHYRYTNWFGVCFSYLRSTNAMDVKGLVDYSQLTVQVNYRNDQPSAMNCFLIGCYVKQKDFPLYGKVQLGLGNVQTAESTVWNSWGSESFVQSDKTYGFAYSLEAGALFPVSDRYALTLSVNYTTCLARPSTMLVDFNTNMQFDSDPFEYSQKNFNFQLGLGFMF